MKAERLKQVDKDYRCHMQAYLNNAAKATKPSGKGKQKYVYNRFKKFYDYEKEIEKALEIKHGPSARFKAMRAYMQGEEV